MDLECPHCRATLRVPESLRRHYGMPVRCHRCRHVFTVPRRNPADATGPTHGPGHPFDRSVSAQQSHHLTRCHGCGTALRVPGRMKPGARHTSGTLALTCPYCLAGFPHHGSGDAGRLNGLFIGLVAGIAVGCLVLWGHNEGYIELSNLGNSSWISGLRRMLADLVYQLRTAAMARLV